MLVDTTYTELQQHPSIATFDTFVVLVPEQPRDFAI